MSSGRLLLIVVPTDIIAEDVYIRLFYSKLHVHVYVYIYIPLLTNVYYNLLKNSHNLYCIYTTLFTIITS